MTDYTNLTDAEIVELAQQRLAEPRKIFDSYYEESHPLRAGILELEEKISELESELEDRTQKLWKAREEEIGSLTVDAIFSLESAEDSGKVNWWDRETLEEYLQEAEDDGTE